MQILKLQTGEWLGGASLEITEVPFVENTVEHSEFTDLLTEIASQCVPGKAAIELLFASQAVENQPYKAQVRVFLNVRMISQDEYTLKASLDGITHNISQQLKLLQYRFRWVDDAQGWQEKIFPQKSYLYAIVKTEQYFVQSSMPVLAYAQTTEESEKKSFASLFMAMSSLPDCMVSFQLLPTRLIPQESLMFQTVQGHGEAMQTTGLPVLLSYQGILESRQLFQYNVLVAGNGPRIAGILSHVQSMMRGGSNAAFSVVNLTAEKINLQRDFLYYPWNINRRLLQRYRNVAAWQSGKIDASLYRAAYLMTLAETVNFFRLPEDHNDLVGISIRKNMQASLQLNERVVRADNIIIGQLADNEDVSIGCSPRALTKHMLVVGKPGTGKTTFAVNLLLQLYQRGIPFLAIEPTKSEYRALIDAVPELQIFTPGNNSVSPFVINPFIPPKKISVEQYIPSLASAFKAAFSMPSPLDTIFQAAIQEAYTQYGWKDYSTADDPDVQVFGLHEFILVFKKLIAREKYSAEVKGNLQSAGVLRLRNLIDQNANIYDTTKSVPIEDILSKPTILELNSIDNAEQKAVLMALLLINICVYTKHCQLGDGSLKNVILIDEAHVLFKAQDGGNSSASTTVTTLENMVAEIRSYGTSVIIADQSPLAVGTGIVKNTDLKIVFQLVDAADCQLMAAATSMSDEQRAQIPQLNVGQAMVSYGLLKEPVMVQTPDIRENQKIRLVVSNQEILERMTYWQEHPQYLIPFTECCYSHVCTRCDLRLRSDANYLAARYLQLCGTKITDTAKLLGYIRSCGDWVEKQQPSLSAEKLMPMKNCVRIRLLRRLMQQKDFEIGNAVVQKVLTEMLNT